MYFFNTLGRKKQVFKSLKNKQAGLYTCGPTVYNYVHIGNLRAYIFEDTLKRVLQFFGYKVKHVMNITDVGHLTSDADEGEDKMEKGAKREGKSVWEIADFYTNAFFQDIKQLNIIKPDISCKATKHIGDMIELIKRIEKNGYTYKTGGNVYFDTAKCKDYGKLGSSSEKSVSRVTKDKNKKNQKDFVLWFTESKFKHHTMKWDSPWGRGYPGWHIECSAMSIKYLGEQFDIHCGGIDHIPVHHTNEIAQSEAATGKPWVNYWMHVDFLVLDKEKMAKSGESFITLKTLQDKGFHPLDYRYFVLNTHYRKQLVFSYEKLQNAKTAYENLKQKITEILEQPESGNNHPKEYLQSFKKAVSDDLDLPKALAVMWKMVRDKDVNNKEKHQALLEMDKVFGLKLDKVKIESVPAQIKQLAEEREKARKQNNYEKADQIREQIANKGYIIEDTPKGPKIVKKQ